MLRALFVVGLIAVGMAAAPGADAAEFSVSSPAFVDNTPIPVKPDAVNAGRRIVAAAERRLLLESARTR